MHDAPAKKMAGEFCRSTPKHPQKEFFGPSGELVSRRLIPSSGGVNDF